MGLLRFKASIIELLIANKKEAMKPQEPIVDDSGYSYCGLEDYRAKQTERYIIKLDSAIEMLNGFDPDNWDTYDEEYVNEVFEFILREVENDSYYSCDEFDSYKEPQPVTDTRKWLRALKFNRLTELEMWKVEQDYRY